MALTDKAVSIVIVTWNNLEYTKLCLESIQKYTKYPYRFVFVDNGSKDGTISYLKKVENSTLIKNDKNLGYAPGVNQGVSRVETEYFCLLNNDIIVSNNWLTDLVQIFGSNPKFEQLTTNSNTIIEKDESFEGVSFDSWMEFKKKHPNWGPEKLFSKYHSDYDKFVKKLNKEFKGFLESRQSPTWFLGGWCLLMRRSILPKIGGFLYDERFKIAFYEDVDLSWRVGQVGGKLAVAKEVYLHHFINTSADKLTKPAGEIASENRDRFVKKWEDFILRHMKEKSEGDKMKLRKLILSDYVLQRVAAYYAVEKIMESW